MFAIVLLMITTIGIAAYARARGGNPYVSGELYPWQVLFSSN